MNNSPSYTDRSCLQGTLYWYTKISKRNIYLTIFIIDCNSLKNNKYTIIISASSVTKDYNGISFVSYKFVSGQKTQFTGIIICIK